MIKELKRLAYKSFVIIRKLIFSDPEIVLNDGERFDPFLTKFLYQDLCHVPRYEFAAKFLRSSDKVIDIACGTGWGTEILSTNCSEVTGVDISATAINYARKKRRSKNLSFVQSDFFKFNSKSDVVVSFETIEHISDVPFEEILGKLISLANTSAIGSVPYMESPGSNPHHKIFKLQESNFSFFDHLGDLSFFYQTADGVIHETKPDENIQNLIFILELKTPT